MATMVALNATKVAMVASQGRTKRPEVAIPGAPYVAS